ncbi:hypothetical protein POX_g08791 [Penicillium oxalicum]|uniref:Uncharacterized protein n=1 Tax=Penicillium oxalicum (strain 114-2 / CGMCC 5302) TaxID=933388 RepID=S7Z9M2_PENO1|nr:hypothetical protein POX_g08791 [Penicillium oxalicum]EPS26909.1 hypothetical protein PDE_01849 [Penicillium oxalicum 114-2]KAI2786406.1 hypothetical protein POX_g08791 [Penicillium oxalicum]
MSSQKSAPAYVSNGQTLSSPPLTVRLNRFVESVYLFLGLYFVSLFSFDANASAQSSQFNIHNRNSVSRGTSSWGSRAGGSSGPASRRGGNGGGPRLGRVDDIRGPECKSCQ